MATAQQWPPAPNPGAQTPQQGQQQTRQGRDRDVLATLAAILVALPGHAGLPLLVKTLAAAGIGPTAAAAAVRLALAPTPSGQPVGTAARLTARAELDYQAAFMLASAQRIQYDLDHGQTLQAALQTEGRYWIQHQQAASRRLHAAADVDRQAAIYGERLGWYLGDRKTHTPVCRAADGHDFSAYSRPLPGFPGTSHAMCGCHAGPPHHSTQTVDEVTRSLIAGGLD